jgi:small subunit ribosomal protein S16
MSLGGIFLAVRIRLQRHGRKKRPFYRLVAADARAQRDGVFLERLGHYNPLTDPADIVIDEEKALKWLRRGAEPTDTAKRLLSKRGILMKFEYEKLGKPMPGAAVDEEVAETDDAQTTDTQASESETGSLLTEATPDEATPESDEEE